MSPTASDITPGRHILLLPLGSWEQHGPHLPLDTDSRIVAAVVRETLLHRDAADFVIAPVVPVTASDEHSSFPGTLSAGTEATIATVVAIARSAKWARGVCIVNGHGGNADALIGIGRALTHEEIAHDIWFPPHEAGDDLHAGHTETSLMLHIDSAAVRTALVRPGTDPEPGAFETMRLGGVASVSPSGVLGDPTTATAEEGRRILTRYSQSLASRLDVLASRWPRTDG